MVGIHSSGRAYAYYETNGADQNGGDIRGEGEIGHGFTGLISSAL